MNRDREPIVNPVEETSLAKGNNHLLVIGIDAYTHCRPLNNAVSDAKALMTILFEKYNFSEKHTITCFNEAATREGIWDAFVQTGKRIKKEDNLVIFYAGHGALNEELDWGYWIPSNALPEGESTYLRNRDIIDFIKKFKCHHIALFSDSCFSGSFFWRES